jgi:CheY-like chemotaxis protein
MSHELRTPLALTIGNIELALGTEGIPEEAREYLTMAADAGESLLSLIQQVLELRNLQEKKVALLEKPMTIPECSRGVIDRFQQQAARKGVDFRVLYEDRLPAPVLGDCERVRQILFHLVGNAVKFTDAGEVEVSIRRAEKTPLDGRWKILFQIRDTGMGMPDEMIERLFLPFSQADMSLTRRFGGAGIGLAISKGLIEQMGGEIRVASEEGKGSVLTFVLPFRDVGEEAERTAEPPPPKRVAPDGDVQARILLVEDEPMVSDMLRMGLVRRGWKVVTAANGREALEILDRQPVDLILMDLKMPVMDGLEATRRIRQREKGADLPIIALTAHDRPEVRQECKEAGMDDFLAKPVSLRQLYPAIEKHLQISGMSAAD